MIDTLVSVLLHLPFGLMLAVVALECFAVSRRSKTADEAVIVALATTGAALVVACGLAGFPAVAEAGPAGPFGDLWIGLGITLLAGCALGLKVLCRKRGIASLGGGSRRARGAARRAKPRPRTERLARASVLLGYRGTLAAAVVGLFAGVLLIEPSAPRDRGLAEVESAPQGDASGLAAGEPVATPAPTGGTPDPEPEIATAGDAEPGVPDPSTPAVGNAAPATGAALPSDVAAGTPVEVPGEAPAGHEAENTAAKPVETETTAIAAAEPGVEAELPEAADGVDARVGESEMVVATNTTAGTTPSSGSAEKPAMLPTTPGTPGTPPKPAPVPAPANSRADYYVTLIKPLFEDRCYDCHGPDKQKGDLRLDSPEGIRTGGKSGPVIIVGQPEKSHLYMAVSLPPDDPDIMPPKGKPLTEPQAGYIRRWILDGAILGDGKQWPDADDVASAAAEQLPDGVTLPDSAFLEQLRAGGIDVLVLDGSGAMLEIGYTHAEREAGQLRLEELAPIAPNIQSLDLKKTKVTDDDLASIEDMTNLAKLNLALTRIGDPSMNHIRKLEKLEYLNLYGTEVSDRSVSYLKDLKTLTKLFLWNSKVTEGGVAKLRKDLPKTDISFGG